MSEATPKKPSFFETLKGALIEEVPDKSEHTKSKPSAAPPARNTPLPSFLPVRTTVPPPMEGQVYAPIVEPDPAALQKLHALLQTAVMPAYAAFTTQYDALKEIILDEGTRFRAAMKTSGCTIEDLGRAVEVLIEKMTGADADFETKFKTNRDQSLGNITEHSNACKAQIAKLQEQLAKLTVEQADLDDKIRLEAARFDTIRGGFKAALAVVVGELTAQKAHIAQQKG
jgi:hypothetical protein